ncbi:MAG: YdeI/OmpD-associated family protein [Myxococcota bacterium]
MTGARGRSAGAAAKAPAAPPRPVEPRFFKRAEDFRRWLEKHHATTTELVIGFYKAAHGIGMSVPEAVEEALCFGWIDGRVQRIDDQRHSVRFTPRKPGSIWSAVNLRRAEALEAAGRMTDVGRAVWRGRHPARQKIYSFEQIEHVPLAPELAATLAAVPKAQRFFDAQTASYKRVAVHWVMSAKQAATRARRMATLVESSAAGQFAPPFRYGASAPKKAT